MEVSFVCDQKKAIAVAGAVAQMPGHGLCLSLWHTLLKYHENPIDAEPLLGNNFWNLGRASVYSFIRSFTRSYNHPSIPPSVHPSIHPFNHPSIHSFMNSLIHPCIHLFTHASVHSSIHPFTQSPNQLINQCIKNTSQSMN
jgi:hypothetical protein